jgi:hypothetical protein
MGSYSFEGAVDVGVAVFIYVGEDAIGVFEVAVEEATQGS